MRASACHDMQRREWRPKDICHRTSIGSRCRLAVALARAVSNEKQGLMLGEALLDLLNRHGWLRGTSRTHAAASQNCTCSADATLSFASAFTPWRASHGREASYCNVTNGALTPWRASHVSGASRTCAELENKDGIAMRRPSCGRLMLPWLASQYK